MRKSPQPRTRILNLRMARIENKETGGLERKLVKPQPVTDSVHFRNASYKSKVQADPQAFGDKIESAFYHVPVYQGMDNKTMKYLLSQRKYERKLASPEWQKNKQEKEKPNEHAETDK